MAAALLTTRYGSTCISHTTRCGSGRLHLGTSPPKFKMALEPQAQTLYDVLEAIFDYADANFVPRGIGLLTTEKTKIIIQNAGLHAELAGLHTLEPA